MLKRYQGELFDLFGEDEAAYARYYRENIDYFMEVKACMC